VFYVLFSLGNSVMIEPDKEVFFFIALFGKKKLTQGPITGNVLHILLFLQHLERLPAFYHFDTLMHHVCSGLVLYIGNPTFLFVPEKRYKGF
jgi:hypothetical protein